MTPPPAGPTTISDLVQAGAAFRSMNGMIKVRTVRGVRLKDGREVVFQPARPDRVFVMYDCGVQMEDDGGATLWVWDEISEILV